MPHEGRREGLPYQAEFSGPYLVDRQVGGLESVRSGKWSQSPGTDIPCAIVTAGHWDCG